MLCGSIEFCNAQLRSGLAMNVIDYDVMAVLQLWTQSEPCHSKMSTDVDPVQGCTGRHVSIHYIKV
jgi:hypothetical protein